MTLVFHPQTNLALAAAEKSLPHALLITGPTGIGKTSVAQLLITHIFGVDFEKFREIPYLLHIEPIGSSIPIESIRAIRSFVSLKTAGTRAIRRAILIEHAHTMTLEAQNTLLKVLEEPPTDTMIVLTTPNATALLPTITSRTQRLDIVPPPRNELTTYFKESGYTDQAIARAYMLSDGLPGLMYALLSGDEEHPLVALIARAKELLVAPAFERIAAVDEFSKDKQKTALLLESLQKISRAAMQQAAAREAQEQVRKWHGILLRTHTAQGALQKNAQAKLLLTDVLLNI